MPLPVQSPLSIENLPPRLEVGTLALMMDEDLRAAIAAYHADALVADELTATLAKAYDQMGSLPRVVEQFQTAALFVLKEQSKLLVTDLINQDVMAYNPDSLLARLAAEGGLDGLEEAVDELVEGYEAIHEDEAAREQIRALRQANRFQVQGGGFGLAGAAKGIATAGAINLATGALVGTFNMAGRAFSAIGNGNKERQLYRASRAGLLAEFHLSVIWLFDTYRQVLREHGLSAVQGYNWLTKRANQAHEKYQNVRELAGLAPEKKQRLLAECLMLDPLDLTYYVELARLRGEAFEDLLAIARFGRCYCPALEEDERFAGPFAQALVAAFVDRDSARQAELEASLREALSAQGLAAVAASAQAALLTAAEAWPEAERKVAYERAMATPLLAGEAINEALEAMSLSLHLPAMRLAIAGLDAESFEREALGLRGALSAGRYEEVGRELAREVLKAVRESSGTLEARRRLVEAALAAGIEAGGGEGLAAESERSFAEEARRAQARRALASEHPSEPRAIVPGERSAPPSPSEARGFRESLQVALFLEQLRRRVRGSFYQTPGYEFKDEALIRRAYAYRRESHVAFGLKALLVAVTIGALIPGNAGGLVMMGLLLAFGVQRWRQRRAWLRFDVDYVAQLQGRVDGALALLDEAKNLKRAARYMFTGAPLYYAPTVLVCLLGLLIPPWGWVGGGVAALVAFAWREEGKKAYETLAEALKE